MSTKEQYIEFDKIAFIKYIQNNIIETDVPVRNPYNGKVNRGDYVIIMVNMENHTQKYKRNPKKKDVKGLSITFLTDNYDADFEERKFVGTIKDYKLSDYGQLYFILSGIFEN